MPNMVQLTASIYHSIDVHDGIQENYSKHSILAWQRNRSREVTRDANEQSDDADNYKKTDRLLGDESGAEDDIP